jgi:hypothetical protein
VAVTGMTATDQLLRSVTWKAGANSMIFAGRVD